MKLVILSVFVILVASCMADSDVRACACPRNYDPVCASDGETYQNDCLFRCAQTVYRGLTVVRAGTCDNFAQLHYPELEEPQF